ncbi:MAG: single-stranded DNA-binding protein [Bacteroidota bacterium]
MNTIRNQVQLIGHLGKDPQMTTFDSGSVLTKFSLATNDYYKKDGERQKQTQWHNLVVWGKRAEAANTYLKKGSYVAISGKLEHRQYKDKEGQNRYVTEIKVNDFVMLDKKDKTDLPF